jgi:putative FmdB family regulatory protein
MPLYEYGCSKCEERIEIIQKFCDPPLAKHKGCGGRLQKILNAPTLKFVGGGWTQRSDNRSPEDRGIRTESKLLSGDYDDIDSGH